MEETFYTKSQLLIWLIKRRSFPTPSNQTENVQAGILTRSAYTLNRILS